MNPCDFPLFRLGLQVREARRVCTQMFKPLGITPQQLCLLALLAPEHGLHPSELAATLKISRAAVSGMLNRLERANWIGRGADPADRRAHRIILTEQGAALLARADPMISALTSGIASRSDTPAESDTPRTEASVLNRPAARAG